MPLAPIESDVTAHLQLFLPAVPFTGERLWFGGQKSRRPRSKRTRASARILSFPYLKGLDFEGNFRTGWVPPRCIQLTTHVHDSSGEKKYRETSRIPICSKHFQQMAEKLSACINFKENSEMSYGLLPTKWTAAWKTRSRGVRLFISKSKSRRSWSSSHISPSQCITCKVVNNPNTSKPEWVTWAQQETNTKVC